jgi:hypothetical protein
MNAQEPLNEKISDVELAQLMGWPDAGRAVSEDLIVAFIDLLSAIATAELGGERVEFEQFKLAGDGLAAVFGRGNGFTHTLHVEPDLDPAVAIIIEYLRAQDPGLNFFRQFAMPLVAV